MTFRIDKVGIVGAGTMGGGIAALLANIGIRAVLLDIVTPGLDDAEKDDPAARNRLVNTLYGQMLRARPAALAREDRARFITTGNVEDDFDQLADCDWIIEVIIEQLGPKQALMERLEDVRKPGSIVSSNTSGIPIRDIAEGRSDDFQSHFLGTHFFNPPRYLRLLELIPTERTSSEVLEFMAAFARDVLGKGVVICKDTPNFIGNRFLSISMSQAVSYGLDQGYSVQEIDAITGPVIGRPRTATFRLLDLIGLDVMGHVNRNLYQAIEDDPYRDVLKGGKAASLIGEMVNNGWLGNKSGQGFYKRMDVEGQRQFWALNPSTMEYEPPEKVRFASIGAVRNMESLAKRLPALLAHDDRAANYVRETFHYMLAYAAYVTPQIAHRLIDVDATMRLGFAWEAGPFEIWDMLGVGGTVEALEASGYEVAEWVLDMLQSGHTSFYQDGRYYDFESRSYQPMLVDPKVIRLNALREAGCEVERNTGASLLDIGDGVALMEIHTPKVNYVDADVLAMADKALQRLDKDFDALVIANEGQDFCVGANVAFMVMAASQGLWDQLDQAVRLGQEMFFRLRHAPKPVVTAAHQRILGGGVELIMSSWATVADHETYMGLVEVGTAGIVPAWGGCKEMLRRKVNPVMRTANADPVPIVQEVFEQIALAKVGVSAWEDKALGYLRQDDLIVMNPDHRIYRAKQKALELVNSGARPPEVEEIYAAGRDMYAALVLGVKSFEWAGYASEHDMLIGRKLAFVLCGGDLSAPAWVDPWYILDLEREAALSLAGEPKTQQRMIHILETGKPLRN
jgi:3-hydroxyacyl-CoA dehydrogenase